KRGTRGVRPYYYLWQAGVFFKVRHLHRVIRFDLVHHVTFVKYWMPSFLAMLNVPFVWGPVGGGESTPARMLKGLGPRGLAYEALRAVARWIGEHDPFVRLTARRSARSLATTTETGQRLRRLGAAAVEVHSEAGLTDDNLQQLGERAQRCDPAVRFVSVGRLLAWKGFHLGLRAFAKAEVAHAEYWVIGDGPERGRLERLARTLGIERNVRFLGALSRGETLQTLKQCDVLVHPSLHGTSGIKIAATTSAEVVTELASVMVDLAIAPGRVSAMGEAARKRVAKEFCWGRKGENLDRVYREVVGSSE
ncbi:MAG: glycosyl transferase family 1, partial [Acidobacteria bacterium]